MKYFFFATFLILLGNHVFAQDFFVPEGAIRPAVDHLKPLNKELQKRTSNYDQRRYVIRDGRVFAVENEVTPETVKQQDTPDFVQNTPQADETPALQLTNQTESTQKSIETPIDQSPQVTVNQSLPSYKNRYAEYIKDLRTFRKTQKLPKNEDLAKVLQTLSKPKIEVIFNGKI